MDEDNNPFAGSGVWGGSWDENSTVGGVNSVYGYRSLATSTNNSTLPSTTASTDVLPPPTESIFNEQEHEHIEGSPERSHTIQELSDEDTDVDTLRYEPVKDSQYREYIAVVNHGTIRDHGQSAVAYTIQHNTTHIMRRYSDFDALRKALVRLFPTVIIPPIPEKHSVVKYLVNPLNAKNDLKIIEKRTRMLTVFLQRCIEFPKVREHYVWRMFLDPTADWNEVLKTPPVSIIPQSNLLAPPLDPTKPSPLHLLLPVPHSTSINNFKPRDEDKAVDKQFKDYEHIFKTYKTQTSEMEKGIKRQKRHFKGLVKDLGELGAYYNAFSLEDTYNLSLGIEKTGQAIDVSYINSEALAFKILTVVQEPVTDISRTTGMALGVLHFRKLKEVQLFIVETTITRRKRRIEVLKSAQEQVERLSQVLRRNAEQSPTIADAVRRLDQGETVQKVSSPWLKLFNSRGTGTGNGTDDISMMNETERELEIEKLQREVAKLEDCHMVILKDIEQVNTAIKDNCDELIGYFQRKWKEVMHDYTESLLIWLKENLKSWEDAKAEVEQIHVPTTDLDTV